MAVLDKSWAAVFADLVKARLTALVLLTTFVGFYLGERGGVALGKAVFAKALDLPEAALGEFAVVAAAAAGELVDRQGAFVIAYAFLIELGSLGGRERLAPTPCLSIVRYD